MKVIEAVAVALAALLSPRIAIAGTWQTLDASEFPPEVKTVLDQVRQECKEQRSEPVEDPQAGVTIIDLDRDGSKDITSRWVGACSDQIKNFGACNTAGCETKIFKQTGRRSWKLVFDETIDPDWFLSTSKEGHFRLMAVGQSENPGPLPRSRRQLLRLPALLEARALGVGANTLRQLGCRSSRSTPQRSGCSRVAKPKTCCTSLRA